MGGGNSKDYANQANDLREHQRAAQERQQRELEAFEKETERNKQERAELRQAELEQLEAEEKRKDEQMRYLMEENKQIREAELARADQIRIQNEENIKKTIDDGNAALDRQRAINQSEITKKQMDHQNIMTKAENQIAETEKNIEAKIVDLKNQKDQTQEKLHVEKKGYHDKKLEKSERNALKLDEYHEETSAILKQRQQNAIEHTQRIQALETVFKAGTQKVMLATAQDVKEDHFIDAVTNTRHAGEGVSNAVSALGLSAYRLKKGKKADTKVINSCKSLVERVTDALIILKDAAVSINSQQETENKNVLKCQEIAKEILKEIQAIDKSLNQFNGSLDDDPIDDSRELFEKLNEKSDSLFNLVNSLPSITKSHHTIGAIVQSTQSTQSITFGNVHIEQTTSKAVVMELEN